MAAKAKNPRGRIPRKIDQTVPLSVEKLSRNVLNVHMAVRGAGWEQWFLLSSDRHHDSHACDRDLELEHLNMVRERNGYVLDFGDLFDAMQGKYDPRREYKEMRKEYSDAMRTNKESYLDAIVKESKNFYAPFADRFIVVCRGNHETAIASHNDTDLIERLVTGLNERTGSQIYTGGYGGWIKFNFTLGGTSRHTVNLKYFHGSGGGGPVTKGVIQSNRQAVFLPDASIVVNGHIHESWILSIPRERLSTAGVVSQDMQFHVRTPTYKNDYGDGADGWHVQKGMPPKPKGAVWLRFYLERKNIRIQLMQDVR